MTPCTTFVDGVNPFSTCVPITPVKTLRTTNLWGGTTKRTFDAICAHPGVTASELIGLTGSTAAGEYAKLLLDAGDIEFVMKRTAPHQKKVGIRHYYIKGHICNRPAPKTQRIRKISDAQANEIRASCAAGEFQKSMAKKYKVSLATIENVIGHRGVYKNTLSN